MNAYLTSVIENVKKKHSNEPEFVQTVEEVFSSLEPVIEKHPEYEKVDLLNRMVEPERMFTFRVSWEDDRGQWHTNIGYRCQFNGARWGPTRAACGSRPTCIPASSNSWALSRSSENSWQACHRRRQRAARTSTRRESRTRRSCSSARRTATGAVPVHRAGCGRARRGHGRGRPGDRVSLRRVPAAEGLGGRCADGQGVLLRRRPESARAQARRGILSPERAGARGRADRGQDHRLRGLRQRDLGHL